jgi:hypothetical protein
MPSCSTLKSCTSPRRRTSVDALVFTVVPPTISVQDAAGAALGGQRAFDRRRRVLPRRRRSVVDVDVNPHSVDVAVALPAFDLGAPAVGEIAEHAVAEELGQRIAFDQPPVDRELKRRRRAGERLDDAVDRHLDVRVRVLNVDD